MQVRDRTLELAMSKQLNVFKQRMLAVVSERRKRVRKSAGKPASAPAVQPQDRTPAAASAADGSINQVPTKGAVNTTTPSAPASEIEGPTPQKIRPAESVEEDRSVVSKRRIPLIKPQGTAAATPSLQSEEAANQSPSARLVFFSRIEDGLGGTK